MSGSVNKVILIGRLGKDPVVRRMGSGDSVVSFGLATSETWRDKASGERKEKTEWHNVVIFNENLGKIAEQYLKKGSSVYIEGSLQTRKWADQSGVEKYTTEVVLQRFRGELTLLDSRPSDEGQSQPAPRNEYADATGRAQPQGNRPSAQGRTSAVIDDDIPFEKEWR